MVAVWGSKIAGRCQAYFLQQISGMAACSVDSVDIVDIVDSVVVRSDRAQTVNSRPSEEKLYNYKQQALQPVNTMDI